MEYTRKMLILLAVVLIIINSGDVVQGQHARIPTQNIPSFLPAGAEMYSKFSNIVDGQTKAWPHYGIVTGDIPIVDGVFGKALYLDGNEEYIFMGNHRGECWGNLEKCPDGYSLTMVIKVGSFSSGGPYYYFSSGGQSDKSHGVAVLTRDKRLVVYGSNRAKRWEIEAPVGAFKSNKWTHLAVTWDREDGLCLTINTDGAICKEDFFTRGEFLEDPLFQDIYIGAPNNSPKENNGRFTIDNMVAYNLVLTRGQILRMARKVEE